MPISDKLSIINDALLLKGQNVVDVEDNGSDEWNVCSAAYERWLGHMLESGEFKFSTEIEDLTRTGDSPDANYEDAYALPTGCLHLIYVRLPNVTSDTETEATANVPTAYRIVGNEILLTDGDATPVAKFVTEPDATVFSSMFITALMECIYAGIESGLKKDQATADRHMAKAEALLERAKTRGDQQEPKKALFKTRHRTARMVRRGG